MDKHQSIKRLGYGFSALVMALSTVAFVPSFNNAAYADDACTVSVSAASGLASVEAGATVCLSADLVLEDIITVGKNLTIDLNGRNITQAAEKNVLKVTNGATLKITGNGNVTSYDGKGITGTGSDGKIIINGGTFTGDFNNPNATLEIISGTFNGAIEAKADTKISGGKFSKKPDGSYIAAGKAVYEVGTTYYVADVSTLVAYNDQNYFMPGMSGNMYTFTAGELAYTNTIPGTTIDNTVSAKFTNEAWTDELAADSGLSFDATTGKVTVADTTETGVYGVVFTDLSGKTLNRKVRVYTNVVSDIDATVNADADLSAALKKSAGAPNGTFALKAETEDATIRGTKFNAKKTGTYTVTYISSDINNTATDFTVTVKPATSEETVTLNLNEEDTFTGKYDENYAAEVADKYSDIISVEETTKDKTTTNTVTVLQPYYGTAIYTLGGVEQKLNLIAYDLQTEVSVAQYEHISIKSLANFPVLANKLLTSVSVSTDHGSLSGTPTVTEGILNDVQYVAASTGTDTITWTLATGTTVETKINVYDAEAVEESLDTQYLDFADVDSHKLTYTRVLGEGSKVEFSSTEDKKTFSVDEKGVVAVAEPGNYTVLVSEAFGDLTVERDMAVVVYGVAPTTLNFVESDEETTDTLVIEGATVLDWSISSQDNITMSFDKTTGEYTITPKMAGEYVLTLKDVVYKTGATTTAYMATVPVAVNVYKGMTVTPADDMVLTIDTAEDAEAEGTQAVVTAEYDATDGSTVVFTIVDEEGEVVIDAFDIENDESTAGKKVFTVKLADDAEYDESYSVAVYHFAGDNTLIEKELLPLVIIDSSKEPTLSVSEEEVSIEAGKTGTFTITTTNVADDVLIVAESETDGITAEVEDGTVTVTVADTVEAGEYTVTVSVTNTDVSATKTIAVTAPEKPEEPIEIVVDAGSDEMSAYVKGIIEDVLENGAEYTDDEGHMRVYNDKIELDVDAIEAAVAAGEKVVMVLVGEDISEYLSEFVDDATAFFTEGVGLMSGGESLVGAYQYNLVLRSSESGTELGEVYELEDGVEIALNIPEAYRTAADGYTRHFFVIRSHADGYTRIDEEDLTIENGAVSFMNDKFSAFCLGYYDTLNASVDTGIFTGESAGAHESSVAAAIVTLISAVVLAGAVKFAKAARK